MKSLTKVTIMSLLIVVIIFLGELLIGLCIWNYVLAAIFSLPTLTAWQFFCLKLLIHILLPTMKPNSGDDD